MKAIVYTEYGPPEVLQLKEVEKPAPKETEVLIRVYATPVRFGDVLARNFKAVSLREFSMPAPLLLLTRITLGYSKPKRQILGSEFAGEIEAVGKDVTRFKPGDQVFGYRGMNFGAYAEYLCMRENGSIAKKPAGMRYEEACTIPYGALMAMSLLGKADIQPGHKVLINGASGGIGSIALQLARYYGAEVTAVCGTPRVQMVKALGADMVIDYTKEDFTRNGETYDLIFDILGKSSFSRCEGSLTAHGRYLLASFKMRQLGQMVRTSISGNKKVICALASEKSENLDTTREIVEAGLIKTVIDRCYPLARTAEAHRYYESGAERGNVVITQAGDS